MDGFPIERSVPGKFQKRRAGLATKMPDPDRVVVIDSPAVLGRAPFAGRFPGSHRRTVNQDDEILVGENQVHRPAFRPVPDSVFHPGFSLVVQVDQRLKKILGAGLTARLDSGEPIDPSVEEPPDPKQRGQGESFLAARRHGPLEERSRSTVERTPSFLSGARFGRIRQSRPVEFRHPGGAGW